MDRLAVILQFQGNRLTQWVVLLPLPTGSSVCLPWVITVAQQHKSTVTPLCQPGNKSVGQPVSKFSQWAKLTAADGSVDLAGQTGQGPGRCLLRAAISEVNSQQECVETRQSTETLMLWVDFQKENGEIQLANPKTGHFYTRYISLVLSVVASAISQTAHTAQWMSGCVSGWWGSQVITRTPFAFTAE